MVSVKAMLPTISKPTVNIGKVKGTVKGAGLIGALGTAMCLTDFLNVPKAFSLEYNSQGEKNEGISWKSGFKELGKAALKASSFLVLPAAITGLACGGALAAGTLGIAAFALPWIVSSKLEEHCPSELDLVADACSKKGINYRPEKVLDFSAHMNQMA